MTIETKFNHGDLVTLVTDIEKHRRMVTSITVHHRGTVFYTLSFGAENSAHVECEIKLAENLEHKKAGF